MKSALVFAFACLALAACNADLDEPWELAHDRIIAVRANPPGIVAGESSQLDLLVGFDAMPVTERKPDLAAVVSPMSMASTVTFDGEHWIVTAPDDTALAAARTELGLEANAPVPVRVGVAAAWPTPVMSVDNMNFGAIKTVWVGESRANPAITGLVINGSEPPEDGAEIVVPKLEDVRMSVEADETTTIVNWLTSCGVMHDFDLPSAYLTVDPEDSQEGQLALVLRDQLGGVSWRVWSIRAE